MNCIEPRKLESNKPGYNLRRLLLKLDTHISGTIYQPLLAANEA